ncbi:hypothetical protein [uncultured Helicobacter sp.]|nr:hypothetical protein [uncultured Helicobacter sp.]
MKELLNPRINSNKIKHIAFSVSPTFCDGLILKQSKCSDYIAVTKVLK